MLFRPLAIALGLSLLASAFAADAPKLEKAADFTVRDGLPNLAAKLKEGKEANIVFLGGSITVGGSGNPDGYVNYLTKWFKEKYPNAKVNVFNAGISGTGSDYGAKRFDRDVLAHKPDLVLIEFCVNDGDNDRTMPMERMVHKAWQKNPNCDLLVFYTLANKHLESYKDGFLPPSASAHERVAAFYGIPTVGTGWKAASLILSDKMKWPEFSGDSCHPKSDGYKIFDEAFNQALPEMLKASAPQAHQLGKSITPNLEVYPKPFVSKPVDYNKPFATAKGEKALKVFPMPIPRDNWIGEPAFDGPDGKTLWRLSWLPRKLGGKLDGALGSDKTTWENNQAVWFAEDDCFTGKDGRSLFRPWKGTAATFSMTSAEIPVLRFIAPETGRYAFKMETKSIDLWQNDDKELGIGALKFTWKGGAGETLAFHKEVKKDAKGANCEFETSLLAGEEVVFVPDSNLAGWMTGGWGGFNVTAALMEASKQ